MPLWQALFSVMPTRRRACTGTCACKCTHVLEKRRGSVKAHSQSRPRALQRRKAPDMHMAHRERRLQIFTVAVSYGLFKPRSRNVLHMHRRPSSLQTAQLRKNASRGHQFAEPSISAGLVILIFTHHPSPAGSVLITLHDSGVKSLYR